MKINKFKKKEYERQTNDLKYSQREYTSYSDGRGLLSSKLMLDGIGVRVMSKDY